MPFDRFSLIIFPIPSRFDGQAEFETSQEWLSKISLMFNDSFSNWLPQSIDCREFTEITKIPYIPYFSFGEKLPAIEQGVSDPTGLGFAYETIALIVANNFENIDEVLLNRGLITSPKLSNTSKEKLLTTPNFYERNAKNPRKRQIDTRGMLSLVTMLVSLAALTVSILGTAKLVLDIFDDGIINSMDGILLKVGILGLAFFFGWGLGLVSIHGFGNLVYPIVIKIYAWNCLAGVGVLYIKVIQKLYLQAYDSLHFWAYLLMLLGGLFILICLHLMVEGHDLRPFAIPLLIISVLHLFVIVYRYVFTADPNGWMLFGDITIFIVMISVSALMLMHIGILSPLRDWINEMFSKNEISNHNGNGVR